MRPRSSPGSIQLFTQDAPRSTAIRHLSTVVSIVLTRAVTAAGQQNLLASSPGSFAPTHDAMKQSARIDETGGDLAPSAR